VTETYSQAVSGARTGAPFVVNNYKVGDTAGTIGGQQAAMATGNQILCKNPDGSQTWYTIDAERTTAAQVVLKPV